MKKHELQQLLEQEYAVENIDLLLIQSKEALMTKAIAYLEAWKAQEFNFVERPDLVDVASAVHQLPMEDMIWKTLSIVLIDGELSLQQILGMYFNQIGTYVDMPYRRGNVMAVIVDACVATGMCTIEKIGKYNHLRAIARINADKRKQYGYILPSIVPHKVRSNKSACYGGISAITGGALKQHDGELCLDHLERLSRIPYRVEKRVLELHNPTFDDTPKFKEKKGRYETPKEVEERRKDFIRFNAELPSKIEVMMNHGNEFYFGARYDTRLRTYLKAYHFDFIGNKHARAFVQPKIGALVTGAEDYA